MAERRMLNAGEVAERLGVSRNTAYTVIRELNVDMAHRGCKVLPGRVSEEFFERAYFGEKIDKEGHDVR